MATRKEKPIVTDVMNLIRKRGGWCEKIHGSEMQRRGLPDIMGCYRGRFLALEGKRPGKEPEPLQEEILDEIRWAKGIAVWFDSVEQVRELLDSIDTSIGEGETWK